MQSHPLSYIHRSLSQALDGFQTHPICGYVQAVVGPMINAYLERVSIGELCLIKGDHFELKAEVVGFTSTGAWLAPLGRMEGVAEKMIVVPTGQTYAIQVSNQLVGRVLDGLGEPMDLDKKGQVRQSVPYPTQSEPPQALKRPPINKPLGMGVRAIDGLLTIGEGQRVGIFAAAGGGKSTLLGMLVKGSDADVIVVALIGERGREVREFIEHELGEEGMARSILVVATSDRPALERRKAAQVATTIAEYFRDQGKRVLLLMDSLTRFARAQREIGLAAGEPPTRRGYPPSVFSELPRLLERPGPSEKGSITAIYTVLVEGDDMTEPVADETRSLLDGHIILSRKLASENHYPAIDVPASASRVMNAITSPEHQQAAGQFRAVLAKYQDVELLLRVGEYQKGHDTETDKAVASFPTCQTFLKQGTQERSNFAVTVKRLKEAVS